MRRAIALVFAILFGACSPAMADDQPTPAMMAPVEKVAHFIATGDDDDLRAFADSGVVIVENFAPYLFEGPGAVQRWADGMRTHTAATDALAYQFGPAIDFETDGDRAYFSLPTNWTGRAGPTPFSEDGGWSFVLVKQKGEWRILSYGWAVTKIEHK
ncbi:MAG TPA: nuclear transport factor 2 family protein [Rhizomicrobium sp.]|jgi:hypothetical protein|nr:nuclear transport factor 2 family protein [Rhizomicrobium sp.]